MCIRPRHPGGRSQNPHSRDCDESTFHRLPPFGLISRRPERNVRVKANVPTGARVNFLSGHTHRRRLKLSGGSSTNENPAQVSHSKGRCSGGVSGTLISSKGDCHEGSASQTQGRARGSSRNVRHEQPHRVHPYPRGGSLCTSSGHSLSTTARISSEMTVTFLMSSMYLCNRRKSAGVITLPPTIRGE